MSFIGELRRRNVIRMAGLYLVAAWLVTQVAGTLLPMFDAPAWIARAVVIALAIGFLPALVFAWVFELTPDGLKRDADVPESQSIAPQIARRMEHAIVALLALALGYFAFDKFVLAPRREQAIAEEAKKAGESIAAESAARVPDKSIAVLPLANEGGDKDEQYFSDGLSENLITALSQFDGLKVISRNSAFQFRDSNRSAAEIGRALGVAHLLEGSVRRLGGTVRVNATLVLAADGSTAWSEHYDRPYKDLFKLQDDITAAVAAALKARLVDRGPSSMQDDRPASGNLEAYNAFLQGNFLSQVETETAYRQAIARLQEATRIDPRYAMAYAREGYAWFRLSTNYLTGAVAADAYGRARKSIDRALELDPDLALAHAYRAELLAEGDFDWQQAEAESRRALELSPSDPRVLYAIAFQQALVDPPERMVARLRALQAIDALNPDVHTLLAVFNAAAGHVDEAERQVRRSLELKPTAEYAQYTLVATLVLRGKRGEALQSARAMVPGIWGRGALALASQGAGDRAAADASLRSLIDEDGHRAAFQVAETYALRKDPERMFEWLERAWDQRDPGITYLGYDPFLQPYRDDPRFIAFARKIGVMPAVSAMTTTR